ncbi:MAG: hypothetical protein MJ177_01135 [Clostridia bacterium]|nr:hypothetical protein [Clostridia bacterium]
MKHIAYSDRFTALCGNNPIPDGMLCGNGDTGIVAGVTRQGIRLYISKCDLWKADEKCEDSDGGIKPAGYIDINAMSPVMSCRSEQRMDDGEIFCEIKNDTGSACITVCVEHKSGCILLETDVDGEYTVPCLDAFCGCGSISERKEDNGITLISRAFKGDGLKFETRCRVQMKRVSENKYILPVRSDLDGDRYGSFNLDAADEALFDSLKSLDRLWWRDFWSRSAMRLPTLPDVENNWYACLYHLAICSLNPKFPPGIYGNFITNDNAWWKGDYHLNYNYQAPFYGVFSANHTELSDCFVSPLEEFMKEGQRLAEKHLGCRGVLFPVGIGPLGMYTEYPLSSLPFERAFLGQRTCAAYCAVILIMRWYAERDTEYLKEHIYPFVSAVGDFWEDYLTYENGKYSVYKDAIHEIPYYKHDFNPKKHRREIESKNNLLALGFVNMVFTALIDMADALGVDADRREKRLHIKQNISPYPTFIRRFHRIFRYTEKGIAWRNDNSLCIQHIYPAGNIGLHSDKKMLKIACNTLMHNDRFTDGNATNSVFPCAARLGINPDYIIEKLRLNYREKQLPNLLLNYGGGCLENCSLTVNTVNETVLQSHEGIISIFPVWNLNVPCEYENLLANGNILVSAAAENGKVKYVRLYARANREIKLEIRGKSSISITCDGNALPHGSQGNIFTFSVEQGKHYSLI